MKLEAGRWGPAPPRLLAGAVSFPVYPLRYFPPRLRAPLLEQRHWWRVVVFPTHEALNACATWRTGEEDEPCRGMVVPMHRIRVVRGRQDRLRSKLGEVLLWRGAVGASVVSHEALHAALATLRIAGLDREMRYGDDDVARDRDREERLCHLLGTIDRQIVLSLYRRGLYA